MPYIQICKTPLTRFSACFIFTFLFVLNTFSQPVISRFEPIAAAKGEIVKIYGQGFSGVNRVEFGYVPAASFQVINDTCISATLGTGNSGAVIVSNPIDAAQAWGFTFKQNPPQFLLTMPINPRAGDKVALLGKNFSNATIQADCLPIYPTSISDERIEVQTSATCRNPILRVYITTPGGSTVATIRMDTSALPAVSAMTPIVGGNGTVVTIAGENLQNVGNVSFTNLIYGKVSVPFTLESPNRITVRINNNTNWGKLTLTSKSGYVQVLKFNYSYPGAKPEIASVSVNGNIVRGKVLTIAGSNLGTTKKVMLGGDTAASFTVVDESKVLATVGRTKNFTGSISVHTDYGDSYSGGLPVTPASAFPRFIRPIYGLTGDTISVFGEDMDYTAEVQFGGTPVAGYIPVDDKQIKVIVGNGSTGVPKVISQSGASIQLTASFTYLSSYIPKITSFSPSSGSLNDLVYLNGNALQYATSVSIGGAPAQFLSVQQDGTSILLRVGKGNSANDTIIVQTKYGADTITGFQVLNLPKANAITPATAHRGDTVTIFGSILTGVNEVKIGNTPVSSFQVLNDSTINAVIGHDNDGKVSLTAPAGTDSTSNVYFTLLPDVPVLPVVNSVTPSQAMTGETVMISGSGLEETQSVSFGSKAAASFIVVSDTQINAVVDSGATGKVTVVTIYGVDSSASFTYLQPMSQITGFNSAIARVGDTDAGRVETIAIYPNPATNYTVVKHRATSRSAKLKLYNMEGKLVRIQPVKPGDVQTTVHLNGLPLGIYKMVWSDGIDTTSSSVLLQ